MFYSYLTCTIPRDIIILNAKNEEKPNKTE